MAALLLELVLLQAAAALAAAPNATTFANTGAMPDTVGVW
jgi:hypothetical protein